MDLIKGKILLTKLVAAKKEHSDYDRTVKLSNLYKTLISGEGIENLLTQFTRREDGDLFDQRKKLTQAITPAVAEAIMSPFNKVARANKVYQSITIDDKKAFEEIKSALNTFWGEGEQAGLDYFMQSRWIELVFTDPNAFLAIEFDYFDPLKEKAKPKPVEIASENVFQYEYKNNVLQWLVAKYKIKYKADAKGAEKDGERYLMYLDDDVIEWIEVDPKNKITDVEDPVFTEVGKRLFVERVYSPKAGKVPCLRVGYKRDFATDGKTYVSPLHPAVPYFMKTIKSVSELDLSITLHTFPQKLQYVSACTGKGSHGCNGGKTRSGGTCEVCKGSGVSQIHTSGQDVLTLPLPKDKEQMIDLDKLVAYKTPPIDLIKFQDQYIRDLKADAIRAIFNGDVFLKTTVAQTATEQEQNMDSVYDTLTPFARKYSALWMAIVKLVAIYTENDKESLVIYHKFPSDFKLKSAAMLMAELQAATNAQAPTYVIKSINDDLVDVIYQDDQDQLAKLKVKSKFQPFAGKSQAEIQLILVSDLTPRRNKILYANFEEIFYSIDKELGKKFYLMADDKQLEEVNKRVNTIISDIDKERAGSLVSKLPGIDPNQNQQ